MRLVDLRDLLLTIGPPVHHYFVTAEENSYIVWAEDSEKDNLYADDCQNAHAIQGTIDYYTRTEFDSVKEDIGNTLNGSDASWYLNSVQRESDTGYIHYEWVFEIDGIAPEPEGVEDSG